MVDKIKKFFTEFLPEVKAEWKKVTKPSNREVMQTTWVVVLTSFVFAVFLWASDKVIQYFYDKTFDFLGL